jgi:hypothetical protein
MKVLKLLFFVGILFTACNNAQQSSQMNADSLATQQSKPVVGRDTTIEYNIEGLSSEGASAKAKYINGKIKECEIYIYGETGQSKISYAFNDSQINVSEKQLTYDGSLENVKSDRDMKIKKEFTYVLDLNGNPIGKVDSDRSDIFSEIKKAVPFEIK